MAHLVLAEHDNAALKSSTLHTITAAQKLGGEIHVLIAGGDAAPAAQAAAGLAGVAKVLYADAPHLARPTAENIAAQVLAILQRGGSIPVLGAAARSGQTVRSPVCVKVGSF